MTTYKTSHPYSERAQHSRLRSTHEHKHQAPAAPRANLANSDKVSSTAQTCCEMPLWILRGTCEDKRMTGEPQLAAGVVTSCCHKQCRAARQSQRGRTSRQTDTTNAPRRSTQHARPPAATPGARGAAVREHGRRHPQLQHHHSTTSIVKHTSCQPDPEGEERYPIEKIRMWNNKEQPR